MSDLSQLADVACDNTQMVVDAAFTAAKTTGNFALDGTSCMMILLYKDLIKLSAMSLTSNAT